MVHFERYHKATRTEMDPLRLTMHRARFNDADPATREVANAALPNAPG